MLNKENVKLKYIIGTFRDDENYPTNEDFDYLIKNWYYNEGGEHFIHTYRGIPFEGKIIFPDNILKEKLENDEKVYNDLLDRLMKDGKISVIKSTKFTTYYVIDSII